MSLWTPAQITTALWLDASDNSTLTLDGSGNVSTWGDKSGNSRDATAQVSNALLDAATLARQSMGFNGARRFTVPHHADFSSSGGISVFGVAKYTTASAGSGWIGKWGADNDWYHLINGGHLAGVIQSGTTQVSANSSPTSTLAHMWGMVINPSSAIFNYRDGTPVSAALSAVKGSTFGPVAIGSYASSASTEMIGQVGEVIIVAGTISQADRELIEGYLAWRWGLQGNLPALHPYKSAAPTLSTAIWTTLGTVNDLAPKTNFYVA